MIDVKTIREYNKVRPAEARNLLCHAPFVNLNFEQNGNITACCYNRSHVLGKYPENTIEEAWFGDKAEQLRQYIRNNDLSGGCSACEQLLNSGNYKGTRAIFYDEYAEENPRISQLKRTLLGRPAYPKVLEFELTNTCNLECTMCNGYFSSAIRKNREHLPDVENPFDDGFIAQVKKFIPYLTQAKFLGGEPFLIDLYYKIWDAIIEINPNIKTNITTNGTILNGRVKDYLEKLNCGIVVSLDSINKTSYEKIRIHASYDRVMSNVHYFIDWAQRKKTYFSIVACPIKKNWMDLPELVRFCNEHNIYLHFNTVWTPESESLRFLNPTEFTEVISFLESNDAFNPTTTRQTENVNNYRGVVVQLKYWSAENAQRYAAQEPSDSRHESFFKFSTQELQDMPKPEMNILLAELAHYSKNNGHVESQNVPGIFDSDNCLVSIERPLEENLVVLQKNFSNQDFINAYCHCLSLFAAKVIPESELAQFKIKADAINSKFETIDNKPELISELTRTGFIYLFEMVRSENIETIYGLIEGRFN